MVNAKKSVKAPAKRKYKKRKKSKKPIEAAQWSAGGPTIAVSRGDSTVSVQL